MISKKNYAGQSNTSTKELVTVAFAEDIELAKDYKKLLEDNGIPAVVKSGKDSEVSIPGIAVVVPEDYLDQDQDAHLPPHDYHAYERSQSECLAIQSTLTRGF